MWFGRSSASVESGGGAQGWALQWLALVRMWLWWLSLTMLVELVNHLWNQLLTVIIVQTHPTLHTLKQRSSHVENLRSVWSWSAEIFEAHTHRWTDRQTQRHTHRHTEMSCFYREISAKMVSYVRFLFWWRIITSSKEIIFSLMSVCLLVVSQQDYKKTAPWIFLSR